MRCKDLESEDVLFEFPVLLLSQATMEKLYDPLLAQTFNCKMGLLIPTEVCADTGR